MPFHRLLYPDKHGLCLLYCVRLSGHLEKKAGFGDKDPALLLGGDLESPDTVGSLYFGDRMAAVLQRLPSVPPLLKYHITVLPGVSPTASIQPAHRKCSFWRGEYNFKVGLRSLHLVFRVPECCFIRITVLFFLGFSRRL